MIWKLDRLGRTTRQLIELSYRLQERGVGLQIITLGVDTSTPAGKLFFAIMAGLAEMEAETIRTFQIPSFIPSGSPTNF